MTPPRIARLLLLFAVAPIPWCAAQQARIQPLQLAIQQTSPKPLFRIDLRNAGTQSLYLNLGVFGDPAFVLLSIKDERGKILTMQFEGHDGPAGRGPSIMKVSIPPGAAYSIPVNLDRYVPMPFMRWVDWMSALGTGRHTIQATYTYNRPVHPDNTPELKGKPITFWEGAVVSNTIPFIAPQ
jgi:hypothetical protein